MLGADSRHEREETPWGLRLIASAWRTFYVIDDDGLLRWYLPSRGEANDAPGQRHLASRFRQSDRP